MIEDDARSIRKAYSKVKKLCKFIQVICGIAFVCFFILWVLFMASVIVGAAVGPDVFHFMQLLYYFIYGGVIAAIIWMVFKTFSDVVNGANPFTTKIIRRMRLASLLMLILVIVEAFAVFNFSAEMTIANIDLGVANDYAQGRYLNINVGLLSFAIVLYCISVIFEYGSLLQRFTDETL